MKRLAVFVDGSELGHKAFETALAWKRPTDSLLVVHCVQKMTAAALIPLYPPIPIIISENDYKILSETNLALEEAGKLLLDRYRKTVDALEWKNVEYELVVAASIKEASVDCIQAHKIDTVFVGSHGLGKIRGILMGSFATYVTSFAGCNVMLVRPSASDSPAPAGTDLGEQTVAAMRSAAADGSAAAATERREGGSASAGAGAGGLKSVLAAQLEPIRDALDKVLKGLNVIQQRNRVFGMADLQPFQNRLLEVERLGMDENGVFGGSLKSTGFGGIGSVVPAGQAQLSDLFHKCHALLTKLTRSAQDAQPSREEVNVAKKSSKKQKAKEKQLQSAKADLKVVMGTALKPVHDELNAILLGLRVLQQKPWHTFEDMRPLQDRLRTLEEKDETSAGVFRAHVHDPGTTHIPAGQAMVSELRQKCHDALEDLTNSARDNFGGLQGLKPVVDPKLVPLLELLQTTRLALRVLAERKPVSAEQLLPLQQSLRDLEADNVVRGVFVSAPASASSSSTASASTTPMVLPGQAILKATLEECYELVENLKQ